MSKTGHTTESRDDAVEAALVDHHLEEVAEMIEQALADRQSSETASGDVPAGV